MEMSDKDKEQMRKQTAALNALLPGMLGNRPAVRKVPLRESRTCDKCGVVFQTRAEKQVHQDEAECS